MKLGDLLNQKQYALKILEMFLHKQCDLERTKFDYSQKEVWNAVKMATEALEKQIPKKPQVKENGMFLHYVCPKCEQHLYYARQEYCDKCGTHIDWIEEG